MTTKQITTGTPTAESASRTFANLTIESGLKPNLQDLLQDKDPHIDELNERTLEVVSDDEEEEDWECQKCHATFPIEDDHKVKQHKHRGTLCLRCYEYITRDDESDDGHEDCEYCGDNHHYEDKCRHADLQIGELNDAPEIYDACEWCRGVMDKEYPRSDRALLKEMNYDDFLATPQDCPRCEYERQECLGTNAHANCVRERDELNAAIDASGNCFN